MYSVSEGANENKKIRCSVACGCAGAHVSCRLRQKEFRRPREGYARTFRAGIYALEPFGNGRAPAERFCPADEENKELYVGMFFYLTLGYHANHSGIYDVSKITNYGKDMDAFYTANNDSSPVGAAHFWGEPVWGYYRSDDEWVIRKQVEMLTMAGVDFLCFDTTNAVLYLDTVNVILKVLQEYYDAGWDVPKFMVLRRRERQRLYQNAV